MSGGCVPHLLFAGLDGGEDEQVLQVFVVGEIRAL